MKAMHDIVFVQNAIIAAFGLIMNLTAVPFLQVIGSLLFVVYFGAMLKMNVVDTKYKGSWARFFKSYLGLK